MVDIYILIYTYAFLLGICFGSFGNVLVYRLHEGLSIVKPGSFCPKCNTPLVWKDLMPLFSWLLLRGKCRYCGEKIPAKYPILELLSGFLFVIVVVKVGINWETIYYIVLVYILLIIARMDWEYFEVFNVLTNILTFFGLVFCLIHTVKMPSIIIGHLIALCITVAPLLLANLIGNYFLKKEFFGTGDIAVFVALSLYFNWQEMLIVLYFSYVLGGLVTLLRLKLKKLKFGEKVPFVPYIALASLITLVFKDMILAMGIWQVGGF